MRKILACLLILGLLLPLCHAEKTAPTGRGKTRR